MTIRVNGETRELVADQTVESLLTSLDLPRHDVAVALNGTVVPRSHWESTPVPDGSDVEVVTAMQGG